MTTGGDRLSVMPYLTGDVASAKNGQKKTSQMVGVSYDGERNKWKVRIRYNNKERFLGRFDTELEAAQAYDQAADVLHPLDSLHQARRKRGKNFPNQTFKCPIVEAIVVKLLDSIADASAPAASPSSSPSINADQAPRTLSPTPSTLPAAAAVATAAVCSESSHGQAAAGSPAAVQQPLPHQVQSALMEDQLQHQMSAAAVATATAAAGQQPWGPCTPVPLELGAVSPSSSGADGYMSAAAAAAAAAAGQNFPAAAVVHGRHAHGAPMLASSAADGGQLSFQECVHGVAQPPQYGSTAQLDPSATAYYSGSSKSGGMQAKPCSSNMPYALQGTAFASYSSDGMVSIPPTSHTLYGIQCAGGAAPAAYIHGVAAVPNSSVLYEGTQHTLPRPMQGASASQGTAAAAAAAATDDTDMWVNAIAAVLDGPGLPAGQPAAAAAAAVVAAGRPGQHQEQQKQQQDEGDDLLDWLLPLQSSYEPSSVYTSAISNPFTQQQQQQHAAASLHHHAAAASVAPPAQYVSWLACLDTPFKTMRYAQICSDAIADVRAQLSSLPPLQGMLYSHWLSQVSDRLRGMVAAWLIPAEVMGAVMVTLQQLARVLTEALAASRHTAAVAAADGAAGQAQKQAGWQQGWGYGVAVCESLQLALGLLQRLVGAAEGREGGAGVVIQQWLAVLRMHVGSIVDATALRLLSAL